MRFQKGQSGNPGGRPKAVAAVKELALKHSPEAIMTLIDVMQHADDARARIQAAKEILDRGIGKAVQAIEVSGPEGMPISALVDAPKQETVDEWRARKARETAAAKTVG